MVLTGAHQEKQDKNFVIKGARYFVNPHGGRIFIQKTFSLFLQFLFVKLKMSD